MYLHTESDELVTHGTNQILEDAHTLVELKMLADMVIEWVTPTPDATSCCGMDKINKSDNKYWKLIGWIYDR